MPNIDTIPIMRSDNAECASKAIWVSQTMPNMHTITITIQLCNQTMPYKHAIVMLLCNAICVSQTMPNME